MNIAHALCLVPYTFGFMVESYDPEQDGIWTDTGLIQELCVPLQPWWEIGFLHPQLMA